jgi:hypothetical protein
MAPKTHLILLHCRDPLVKATIYWTKYLHCSGSNHRSGMKLHQSGNTLSLWFMKTLVMLTGVSADNNNNNKKKQTFA